MQDNDNSEAVGSIELRTESGFEISFGEHINQVNLRINKVVGTAGNTTQTYNVMVFMRGTKD